MYQVFYEGELILESNEVVKLKEHHDGKDFPPVIYFPLSALSDLERSRTELTTTCSILVLHRFEYSDFSAFSEEACRHRLRAGGLEKVNRVRRQGLQSGTPTGA